MSLLQSLVQVVKSWAMSNWKKMTGSEGGFDNSIYRHIKPSSTDIVSLSTVFSQNFWYTTTLLIIGKEATSTWPLPDDTVDFWKSSVNIMISNTRQSRQKIYSQYLLPACTEAVTVYTKHIVELFQQQLISFILLKFSKLIPNVRKIMSREEHRRAILLPESMWPPLQLGKPENPSFR
ncbi:hypothetical protein F4703DRAFT_1788014 [Phycomyces blakesleeanus]